MNILVVGGADSLVQGNLARKLNDHGVDIGWHVAGKNASLDALPKAARDHIINSAREHAEEFREGGRKLDDEASAALAKRLKSVNLWRNQHAWEAVQRSARNSLAGRLYSKSLMRRVEEIVGKDY